MLCSPSCCASATSVVLFGLSDVGSCASCRWRAACAVTALVLSGGFASARATPWLFFASLCFSLARWRVRVALAPGVRCTTSLGLADSCFGCSVAVFACFSRLVLVLSLGCLGVLRRVRGFGSLSVGSSGGRRVIASLPARCCSAFGVFRHAFARVTSLCRLSRAGGAGPLVAWCRGRCATAGAPRRVRAARLLVGRRGRILAWVARGCLWSRLRVLRPPLPGAGPCLLSRALFSPWLRVVLVLLCLLCGSLLGLFRLLAVFRWAAPLRVFGG